MNADRLFAILLCGGFLLFGAAVRAAEPDIIAGTGPNQRVASGDRVVLMGDGRSVAGRVVKFAWTQVDGPRVTLHDSKHSTARFVAPKVTTTTVLNFRLTVTDIYGGKGSSTVTVTVEPQDKPHAKNGPSDHGQRDASQ